MTQSDAINNTQDKKTGAENIHWKLDELFKGIDDPKIDEVLIQTKQEAKSFMATYKEKLATLSSEELKIAYEMLERILSPLYKLSQYTHLNYAIDTSNEKAKKLMSKVEETESQISNLVLFFELELGHLSEADFEKFKTSTELSNYSYNLNRTRETAKYNLSEKEEQVINLKNLTGVIAFRKLYNDLTSSFQFEFELDGKAKTLNGSELRALRQHENPDIRRRAMKLFFQRYEDHQLIITHIYNSVIKNHNIEKSMRKYPSAISMMNIHNNLDEEVIQVLHDVTTESYKLVQRYYKIKSKMLNLDDMTLADIYAPLPESSKFYTWNDAKDIVLKGFHSFDEQFYQMANKMFNDRIDAPVEPTKRGGAFCSSATPDHMPYVMVNFLGRQRDISTLAHELGHAIHDMFCSKQTLFNYHPILPLAETASVFSEMIITNLLLKNETDKQVKQSILTDKLEDIFATSHRQNMFSRFEISSHKTISERLMTTNELSELYNSELKLMFGDSVRYTDEYNLEWSTIPHMIEVPFYVYAYNFANLLVIALYQQYLEEGKTFVPRLKQFLTMGSSASPVEITQLVNVDIKNPDFWRKSLVYIEGLIDELESLVDKS